MKTAKLLGALRVSLTALLLTACIAPTVQSPPLAKPDSSIKRQEITINFGDFQTKAELTYPAQGAGPFPTVILIPGSSPEDMDASICTTGAKGPMVLSHIFLDIATDLSACGYAVLRYNKHYVTGPCQADYQKFYTKLDLQQMVKDAAQVLSAAQANAKVDAKQLFVYGWSEGSSVGAALVVEHPEVAGFIVQGPVSEPWKAIFQYQFTAVILPYLHAVAPDGNVVTSTLTAVVNGNGGLVAKGAPLYLVDITTPQTATLTLNPFFDKNQDGKINIDSELAPNIDAYLDQLFQSVFAIYAPGRALPTVTEQAPKLKMPVLILQGENDANVPVAGTRKLNDALNANPDHTLKIYLGLGHTLGPATSAIDDNFRPIAQPPRQDLAAWLKTHTH